jgi:hypothetical protein
LRNAAGPTRVDSDSPTGERLSSARAKTSRMSTRASTGVVLPVPPAQGRKSRNAIPMPVAPIANFAGVDGARSPSLVQSTANSGASTMTQNGSIELGQLTGNSQPNRFRSNRVSE